MGEMGWEEQVWGGVDDASIEARETNVVGRGGGDIDALF